MYPLTFNAHDMKKVIILTLTFILFLPSLANAQGTLFDLINEFESLLDRLIPIIIGLALVGVLWGLAQYSFKAGDEKAQQEAKRIMFWGVIFLFAMVSIWGLVSILQTMFGVGGITGPRGGIPTLNESLGPGGGRGGNACPPGGCP